MEMEVMLSMGVLYGHVTETYLVSGIVSQAQIDNEHHDFPSYKSKCAYLRIYKYIS